MRQRFVVQVVACGVFMAWAPALVWAQEPRGREVLLLGARNAWKLGAYETAITRYRSAIELEPSRWEAIAELGWLLIEIGRPSEALQQFEMLATLSSDDPLAVRERLKGLMVLRQLKRVDQELSALRAAWTTERWARLMLADLRLMQMRYREAETLYAQLVRQDQEDREATIGLADVATALGDHQRAADILDQVRARFPHDPEVMRRRVVNLASRRRPVEAFLELTRIEPVARRQVIDAELRNIFGEHMQAQRLFESLRVGRPTDYRLLIGSAEAWLGQEDDRETEDIYRAILREYPEDIRPRLGLGELLTAEKRYDEADAMMRTLHDEARHSAPVQYGQVRLHLAQGRRDLGREALKRMAGAVGSLTEAKTIQRRMVKEEDFFSAIVFSEEVMTRGLQDSQLLQGYLDSLLGTGQIGRAKTVAVGFLKQAEANFSVRLTLARFYLASGDRTKAKALLRETEVSADVGSLYYDLKDYNRSRRTYESVLKTDPVNLIAVFGLARTLSADGHPDRARELLRRLIERVPEPGRTAVGVLLAGLPGGTPEFYRVADGVLETLAKAYPDNLDLQLALATVSIQGHNNREAATRLRRLKEVRPDNPLIALRLAKVLSYERAISEASTVYDDYVRLKPYDVIAQREQARAYGWAFQYERALTEYERILARFPNDAATALERKGKEALWLGRLRQARSALDPLTELEPSNSESLFDLGQIAFRGGRPSEGRDLYHQLLSVVPGHRQAELALELNKLSERPLLTLGYTYINQKGYDNKRSITYGLASAKGRVRASDDLSVLFGYENTEFHFGLLTNTVTGGFLYSPNGYVHVDGFVSELHYNEIGRDRVNIGVGVSYETLSGVRLRADFERKDLWENRTTVLDGITMNRLAASASGTLARRLDWTIRGDYTNYSDDNTRIGGEFLASYRLLWFPETLRLIYRVNGFGFQRERSYFSPGAYATNTVAMEFQHWLGYPTREDFLAEAPRNRYTLYYGISMDSNGKLFHEWQGNLIYSLARHIEVGLSLKAIRSSVYDEWNAGALIAYTF